MYFRCGEKHLIITLLPISCVQRSQSLEAVNDKNLITYFWCTYNFQSVICANHACLYLPLPSVKPNTATKCDTYSDVNPNFLGGGGANFTGQIIVFKYWGTIAPSAPLGIDASGYIYITVITPMPGDATLNRGKQNGTLTAKIVLLMHLSSRCVTNLDASCWSPYIRITTHVNANYRVVQNNKNSKVSLCTPCLPHQQRAESVAVSTIK